MPARCANRAPAGRGVREGATHERTSVNRAGATAATATTARAGRAAGGAAACAGATSAPRCWRSSPRSPATATTSSSASRRRPRARGGRVPARSTRPCSCSRTRACRARSSATASGSTRSPTPGRDEAEPPGRGGRRNAVGDRRPQRHRRRRVPQRRAPAPRGLEAGHRVGQPATGRAHARDPEAGPQGHLHDVGRGLTAAGRGLDRPSTDGTRAERHRRPSAAGWAKRSHEAALALEHDDVPVGAVVVRAVDRRDRRPRAQRPRARPRPDRARRDRSRCGPRRAARGTWRLTDHALVVTLEPCPMCAGAAWAARARPGRVRRGRPEGRRGRAASTTSRPIRASTTRSRSCRECGPTECGDLLTDVLPGEAQRPDPVLSRPGGMRERPNRMVSKTIVAQVTVGSNPTPSATNEQVRGRIGLILSLAARSLPGPWHGIWHGTGRRTLSIRERRGPNGTSYQLVVYAGRDGRGTRRVRTPNPHWRVAHARRRRRTRNS